MVLGNGASDNETAEVSASCRLILFSIYRSPAGAADADSITISRSPIICPLPCRCRRSHMWASAWLFVEPHHLSDGVTRHPHPTHRGNEPSLRRIWDKLRTAAPPYGRSWMIVAIRTSSARFRAPIRSITQARWLSTVFALRLSRIPISLLDNPATTSSMT